MRGAGGASLNIKVMREYQRARQRASERVSHRSQIEGVNGEKREMMLKRGWRDEQVVFDGCYAPQRGGA